MNAIKFLNVTKSFGEKSVLDSFSHTFEIGSRTCIMGASGVGKTTLLNLVLGLEKADSGEISGVPDDISAVFQEDRLSESFSAVANIIAVTGKSVPESEINKCLSELGLGGNEKIPVSALSGGMKRRVAIATALLKKSELIVLDEPFKGLDEELKLKTVSVILARTKGKTLLVATHDINDAKLLSAEILNI
jgi:NitT/TauT family transport system ATP-binding protein